MKKQSDEMLTIVRGGGTLLGGSGLLGSAGSLPHVLIDATSVFGILNKS